MSGQDATTTPRPRAREAGVIVGVFATGPNNAITDVPGVRVGHATVTGNGANTGVTAILPPVEPVDPLQRRRHRPQSRALLRMPCRLDMIEAVVMHVVV